MNKNIENKKRYNIHKKILIISILFLHIFGSQLLLYGEEWKLEVIDTIPYLEISKDFFGISYDYSFTNKKVINFFAYDKQHFLNLEDLTFNSFGEQGKGPGEFLYPSPMIAFKDRRYCIDSQKMSLMIFDKQNILMKEIKLDYQPLEIFKVSDKYIGIGIGVYEIGKESVLLYSLDGEFIRKIVNTEKKLYGISSKQIMMLVNTSAEFIHRNDNLYIFYKMIPVIKKYNIISGKSRIIKYRKQLPFKPGKPYFMKANIGIGIGWLYQMQIIKIQNDFAIIKVIRLFKKKREREIYFFKITLPELKLERIKFSGEIINEDTNKIFVIYEDKLYTLDNENENLVIYKIMIEG